MYLLNEKKFIEKRLLDDSLYKESITTLLVRYYIEQGMEKEKVIESVSQYYKDRMSFYKELTTKLTISSIVDRELKKPTPLINIKYISVSESEYNVIKSLNNKREEKVLFSYLVLAKYLNIINPKNNDWTTKNMANVFSMAKVNLSQHDQCLMLNKFYKAGLISLAKGSSTNVKINFIDNKDESIKVDSFVDLGKFYTDIGKNKLVRCQECDKLVKRESPKATCLKYCNECAKRIKNEQNIKSYYKNK